MALANFSLPFGALAQPWGVTLAPLHPLHQLASNTNNLLYSPADHQQPQSPADAGPPAAGGDYYKNNPYGPPEAQVPQQQQQQPQPGYPYSGRRKQGSAYLPPTGGGRNSVYHIQQQQQQQAQAQQHVQHTQQSQLEANENSVSFHSSSASSSGQSQSTLQLTQSAGRGPAEGSYTRYPGQQAPPATATKQQKQYYNAHGSASSSFSKNTGSFSITSYGSRQPQQQQQPQVPQQPQQPNLQPQQPPLQPQAQTQSQRGRQQTGGGGKTETPASTYGVAPPDNYPERAPGFTRVQAGQGSRTQVHAVLDYDVEEGDEEEEDDDGEYYDAQGQSKGE